MTEDEAERAGDFIGPLDLPDDHDPQDDEPEGEDASIIDDVFALLEDGKTYAEAEIAFQKSRAAYVADRAKGALAFGLAALAVLHIALIAGAVGLVIALAPLTGPWGATAIVTVGLVVAGVVLLRRLKGRVDDIIDAFSEREK